MEHWEESDSLELLVQDGLISLDRGRVISSKDLMEFPGIYPVYSSSAQKNGLFGTFDFYDFDEELITWSVDGGGYFFYRPKHKFSVTNVSGILHINDLEKYDYKFLYYVLDYQHRNQIFDYVDKAHPSVIKRRYFIPKIKLNEQTQITTILSKVDEAISQTEQLITKYNRIKTGLMQYLLTKGIDEHGNIRSEETHEFKDCPLGRIPVDWECVSLGQISKITSGVTLGKEYPETGTIELPYLRVANVQDGYFDLSEIKTIRIPVNQRDRYLLKEGDVLMNEGGDFDKLGRGSVWKGEIKDCIHQNHVFKVRLDIEIMNPEYLAFFSASHYGKKFFILSSKQSTNLASINKTQLKSFPILKPDISEQNRIIQILNRYSELINEFKYNHRKLSALKTGLMQDLLSGKVRVNNLKEAH